MQCQDASAPFAADTRRALALALAACRNGRGDFTPGALTGVSGCCCLRDMRGGGYVLLHVGAVVERRDEAEEASGSLSGELRNSRASCECWSPFWISGIKTGYGGRLACPSIVSAQTRRQAGREQGLKILAREVTNIAVQKAPTSQADWLWDCTTPQTALTGTSVSAGAIAFSRKTAATRVRSSPQASLHVRRRQPVAHPHTVCTAQ